jgi:outer membrane biosynthesis protein TonB
MMLRAECVGALALLLLLSGCTHQSNQAQNQPLAPPIVDSPPAKTTQPTDLPPPVLSTPQPAAPATNTASSTPPPQPAPKPKHKKPKPAEGNTDSAQTPSSSTPAPSGNQQASSGDGSGVSAIGQLSTGDPSDVRTETENSIAATEKGLKDINRKLNDQEEKTAEQIREYIKEARKALATGDIDGAHGLADKAKLLLSELTQ